MPGAVTPGASYSTGTMASQSTNGMAIAALVCGILGVVSCGYTFFVAPVLAIIFAVIAKKQIAQRGQAGAGLATAGLVLGIIGAVISVLILLFIAGAIFSSSTSGNY